MCTGSILIGAAGPIAGRRAACPWAWRDVLPMFGAIPDERRIVRDGNVITGGSITAGIDFALAVASEVAGEAVAQQIQLAIEYAPAPPWSAGRPETAPPDFVAAVAERNARYRSSRQPQLETAARRLAASQAKSAQ